MLVLEERGKPEYVGKDLSEQGRGTNNKVTPHMTPRMTGMDPRPHWWEASALITAPSYSCDTKTWKSPSHSPFEITIFVCLFVCLFICFFVFSECQEALGMESSAISDSQISASSENGGNHAANQGRLNFQETSSRAGAWQAATSDLEQWLQIDLGNRLAQVTRVATQGRHYSSQWPWSPHKQWVTKYKLQYSDDGVNFQYYKEQGQPAADKVKIVLRRTVGGDFN